MKIPKSGIWAIGDKISKFTSSMTEKKRRHTRDQSYAEQVNPGLELAADVKKGSKS